MMSIFLIISKKIIVLMVIICFLMFQHNVYAGYWESASDSFTYPDASGGTTGYVEVRGYKENGWYSVEEFTYWLQFSFAAQNAHWYAYAYIENS